MCSVRLHKPGRELLLDLKTLGDIGVPNTQNQETSLITEHLFENPERPYIRNRTTLVLDHVPL